MTRTGKIARLPLLVRAQLNRRLQDGELQTKLVEWLNSLPLVQAVLQAEFAGRAVTEQNLSEWKAGGFKDWLALEESLEMIQRLSVERRGSESGIRRIAHRQTRRLAGRPVRCRRPVAHECRERRCRAVAAVARGLQRPGRVAQGRPQPGTAQTRTRLPRDRRAGHEVETRWCDERVPRPGGKEMEGHPNIKTLVDSLRDALLEAGVQSRNPTKSD